MRTWREVFLVFGNWVLSNQQVVYELPDMVGFRESDGFKDIAQRNPPTKQEIETIYENVQFSVRFYEQVQIFEGEKAKENGTFSLNLISSHVRWKKQELGRFVPIAASFVEI